MKIDWARLIKSVVESRNFKNYRTYLRTDQFWGILLGDDSLAWTAGLRRLIKSMLTITSGSVACESGFSRYGTIMNKMRSRLTLDHVEAILRVATHGPDSVEDFEADRYARFWLMGGRYPPDKQTRMAAKSLVVISDVQLDALDLNDEEPLSFIDDDANETAENVVNEEPSAQESGQDQYKPQTMLF
jgi:hypothetical protein